MTPGSYELARFVCEKPGYYDCDFFGTFAPFLRASERPIAIACLRLFTAPPLPPFPERRVPFFSRRTALSTALPAALPYLRPLDFLREPPFFAAISSSQKHVAPSDPLSTARNYDAATTVCVVEDNLFPAPRNHPRFIRGRTSLP